MSGLTLIELMVAMVLGLVVIGGAVSLTMANRQSYRTNEGLSQVQESARTAFELLARDLRQAGVSGCDNEGRIANVLDDSGGQWWVQWFGLRGYNDAQDLSAEPFGSERGQRSAGTDAVQLQGIQGVPLTIEDHSGVTMQINAVDTDIEVGDVMIACDFDHATIFRVSNYNDVTLEVTHDTGVGTPANASSGLGYPSGSYAFPRNSLLGHFFATDWYVGENGRTDDGGRSLFRRRVAPGGVEITEEVVAGISDLQLLYRVGAADQFVAANILTASNWGEVNAVRVDLAVESADTRVTTDPTVGEGRIRREFSQIITLRNRVP